MPTTIQTTMAAIDYIESRLHEKLDLETVARAVHYSKYHLHRMFTGTVGLSIHDYIQRRQLTEAAKLLVFSDRPILEIALLAGYESQQAFTDIFTAMYKKPPGRYREDEEFYPLQLRYVLNGRPDGPQRSDWRERIVPAAKEDIPAWMELVRLVIDGFPHLDEEHYLKQLREAIRHGQALILKDADTAVGIMLFQRATGSIDFLGVHPQYRKMGIAKAFCEKALRELSLSGQISVTTFRDGDRADNGYRKMWKGLGFAEAELLVEFGYPTQRFILRETQPEAGELAVSEPRSEAGEPAANEPKPEAGEPAVNEPKPEAGEPAVSEPKPKAGEPAANEPKPETGEPAVNKPHLKSGEPIVPYGESEGNENA